MNCFTKNFVLLSCIFATCVVFAANETKNPERYTIPIGSSNDSKGAELVFIRCPAGKLTIPGGNSIEIKEEFYIMETEMTVEVYQALVEEAKNRGFVEEATESSPDDKAKKQVLSFPTIDELNNRSKEKSSGRSINPMKPTDDEAKEPVRFLAPDDAKNIVNVLNGMLGESENIGKGNDVQADNKNIKWTKQMEKNKFSIPSFDQWKYAALAGFEKKQLGSGLTVGDIVKCVIEDWNITDEKDKKLIEQKVCRYLEDEIYQVRKDLTENYFNKKEKDEYKYFSVKSDKKDKGIDTKDVPSNINAVLNYFLTCSLTRDEEAQAKKISELSRNPFGEDIYKVIDANADNPDFGSNKKELEEKKKLWQTLKDNYDFKFADLLKDMQTELDKKFKWGWKMRLTIDLYVSKLGGSSVKWKSEFSGNNFLEIFSSQCDITDFIIVYNFLTCSTQPDTKTKDDKEQIVIEKKTRSDNPYFYSVKDERFRPNAIGLYGMFSSTMEYVQLIDKQGKPEPELKIYGISDKDQDKDGKVVEKFFRLCAAEPDTFDTESQHKKNPVGIRLVLIPDVDFTNFSGLFYRELLIRPNQQEVIDEATGLVKRYPNTKMPDGKHGHDPNQDIKQVNDAKAPFLQLLKNPD